MGFFIAIIVFAVTALTANHLGHLQEHNQVLTQKVQVLESQTDGQNLHIDGVAVSVSRAKKARIYGEASSISFF